MDSRPPWNRLRRATGGVPPPAGERGRREAAQGGVHIRLSDMASLRPKPTNMTPAARSSQCMVRCTARARRAIQAAASAQPTLTGMALTLNSVPSARNTQVVCSTLGAMNCGTKARKKMATLGLSTLVQKPPLNTRRRSTDTSGAAVRVSASSGPPLARERSSFTPTYSRYAAPAHLSRLKAVADAANKAPTPKAAATMWTKQPAVIPSPATMPARAPLRSECVTTYSTSGPGVRLSSQPAAMNSRSCEVSGMVFSCGGRSVRAGARGARLTGRRLGKEATHRGDGVIDTCRVHVQVGDKTQADQAGGQHAVGFQEIQQRRATAIGHVDEDDVGLGRLHRQAVDPAQAIGQSAGVGVVVGEPVHMVVQRMQRAGGQQPGLAQAAAGHLADAAGGRGARPRRPHP